MTLEVAVLPIGETVAGLQQHVVTRALAVLFVIALVA
jgi:hypothetical protein